MPSWQQIGIVLFRHLAIGCGACKGILIQNIRDTAMWNIKWFMRMTKWARNPPSTRHVIFVFSIVALGLAIAGIEKFVGWPEFMTIERTPKRVKINPVSTD